MAINAVYSPRFSNIRVQVTHIGGGNDNLDMSFSDGKIYIYNDVNDRPFQKDGHLMVPIRSVLCGSPIFENPEAPPNQREPKRDNNGYIIYDKNTGLGISPFDLVWINNTLVVIAPYSWDETTQSGTPLMIIRPNDRRVEFPFGINKNSLSTANMCDHTCVTEPILGAPGDGGDRLWFPIRDVYELAGLGVVGPEGYNGSFGMVGQWKEWECLAPPSDTVNALSDPAMLMPANRISVKYAREKSIYHQQGVTYD